MPTPIITGWSPSHSVPAFSPCELPEELGLFPQKAATGLGLSPQEPPHPDSPASSPDTTHLSDHEEAGLPCERNGDPNWVPRPRNPFIIFRCEYSKTHTRDEEERRGVTVPSHHEKTLSKRAGEAWATLTPAERKPFEDRAKAEKEAHSREFPDYKFRPNKKPRGGRTRSLSKKKAPAASSLRSTRGRARLASSERLERAPRLLLPTRSNPLPLHHSLKDQLSTVSAPVVPSYSNAELSRPRTKRRSHSMTEFTWNGAEPADQQRCDDTNFDIIPLPYCGSDASPIQYVSPLSAVSSSLAGWDSQNPSSSSSVGGSGSSFPTSPLTTFSSLPTHSENFLGIGKVLPLSQVPTQLVEHPIAVAINPGVMWSEIEASAVNDFGTQCTAESTSMIEQELGYSPPDDADDSLHALQEFGFGLSQSSDFGDLFVNNYDYSPPSVPQMQTGAGELHMIQNIHV